MTEAERLATEHLEKVIDQKSIEAFVKMTHASKDQQDPSQMQVAATEWNYYLNLINNGEPNGDEASVVKKGKSRWGISMGRRKR